MNIEIENIQKRYGDVTALDGLSLTIPSGSTFGLLGTNGAGKTTLFRLLVGHETPDSGRITVGGVDSETAGRLVRERVGFLPDRIGFPGRLTGREALTFHARMRGVTGDEVDQRIDEAIGLVGLVDAADRDVAGYSNGMGRRLGLASVLVGRPAVLVLDEPTAGLDPRGIVSFHRIIEQISAETDSTIVFASHALDEVERLCDEIAILHEGRLRLIGSVDDIAGVGPTTIQFHVSGDTTVEAVAETIGSFGSMDIADHTVRVTCTTGDPIELVTTIDPAAIDHMTIEEPGLDRAFLDAVVDEGATS